MKLALPVQSNSELECVSALALPPSFGLIALTCGNIPVSCSLACRTVRCDGALPSLSEVIELLTQEQPEACLITGESTLAQFTAFAADLLDIPVFTMVSTAGRLADLTRRTKPKPDLFFLTDSALLPSAAGDSRYGLTLAPTGDPRTDPEASARIAEMAARWEAGIPQRPELSVIVPAYREAANLPFVCERLGQMLDDSGIAAEILLIDDGSPDETYEVALRQMWRSARIRAFTKPAPRGMGNAIRYGLDRARAPIAAVTMGDASDDVARIPEMFRKVRDEGFSLAIGSRYGRRENYANVPLLYRFWSRCFRVAARTTTGLALRDYTNAFRVFSRGIFASGGPESGGFEISPEVTFKAWFRTRRIAEVDVKHLKRASGQSNFSFLRAGPGYTRILAKAAINRLTGYWFHLGWYLNLEQEGAAALGRPREERA